MLPFTLSIKWNNNLVIFIFFQPQKHLHLLEVFSLFFKLYLECCDRHPAWVEFDWLEIGLHQQNISFVLPNDIKSIYFPVIRCYDLLVNISEFALGRSMILRYRILLFYHIYFIVISIK